LTLIIRIIFSQDVGLNMIVIKAVFNLIDHLDQ
jgi:hypothetical protein